jgi:hypothetical protein
MYLSRGVRLAHADSDSFVRIKLTRKLSSAINDVDLRPFTVGDVIDLERSSAEMLVAEGWAEWARGSGDARATADDRPPKHLKDRK